jgi:hypothetical protein
MHTSHTLGIAVDQAFAIDRKGQSIVETLRRQILSSWDRLFKATPSAQTSPEAEPLSGYYKGAYERANASAPVTSFDRFS